MQKRDIKKLKVAIGKARKLLENCEVCPRNCHVDRTKGELGFCKVGDEIKISSFGPHFGEESPLVGMYGSGTIFLTSCNLGCIFCQNYDISHQRMGRSITLEECSGIMLKLQQMGCHNINFVTPTHVTPGLMEAMLIAWEKGLSVPTVYNCGGYESLKMLKLLEGFVDIYMPDAKFADEEVAKEMSATPYYFDVLKSALKEMHRQAGDLELDSRGIAKKGLLIRHLVLPDGLSGTEKVLNFIAKEISPHTYINIMDQYHPCYEAPGHPKLGRALTRDEYREAINVAEKIGLHNFL